MMQKLVIGRHKGFTLIELLVVMLLVGILLTMGITSIGQWGSSDRSMRYEIIQLQQRLQQAQQQAVLWQLPTGLLMRSSGYQMVIFSVDDEDWQGDSLWYEWPTGSSRVVLVGGDGEVSNEAIQEDVVPLIFSVAAVVDPFELRFYRNGALQAVLGIDEQGSWYDE